LVPEADAFGQLDDGAMPTSLTLLEPPAAAPNGIEYLRYGLAEGIPATGGMSAPGQGW
jgi:hypothetical protein